MKKIWVVLGIISVAIVGFVVSNYSIELTNDNIMTLEIGRGGQPFLMGLNDEEVKGLTNNFEQLTFRLSIITPKSLETAKFDILVRDKSGKGVGVVRVYDETKISYEKSILGLFSLKYQAKGGSLDLQKLSLLSR